MKNEKKPTKKWNAVDEMTDAEYARFLGLCALIVIAVGAFLWVVLG